MEQHESDRRAGCSLDAKWGALMRFAPARLLVVVMLLNLGACAVAPPPAPTPPAAATPVPPPPQAKTAGKDYAVVSVHYGTNRKSTGSQRPDQWYGSEANEALEYGKIDVSIPREHRMGELEAPAIGRLEFSEDPNQHVMLLSLRRQHKDLFFYEMQQRLSATDKPKALVFIHGYNVDFANAARRTAQLAYDLGFAGVPVFYSWPSQASLAGYWQDEKTVLASEPLLASFLDDLATKLGDTDIYIIAHSMGNRPTTRALATVLQKKPQLRAKFKEIILMAPDIDATVFKTEIAPRLVAPGQHISLYASSNDLALKASKALHGAQRLGDSTPTIAVMPGVETIDASEVETDLLGHSYFGDARSVLSDLIEVVRGAGSAENRSRLVRMKERTGDFFRFVFAATVSTTPP